MATEEFGIIAVLQARVDGFVNGFRQASDTVNDFTARNQKTFDSFKKVGAAATAGGLAVAGGLGAAVTVAASFESQMSKVKAISGATDTEFALLTSTAKQLGATTSFSASQAAEGMEKLALSGWKTNDIVTAMPGMLNLAAAGALGLSEAADITSNTMSSFGLSAEKAGHAADVFAYAQANANTDVSEMGEAMKYLAPVANALGWELEESAAAVMKLADSGVKGSMAGQAFASSLTRLAKPTKAMNKVMDKLGLSFFDAEGNMKSMPEVMQEIERGTAGMTKEQKSATLSTLFGAEAYKHWAILLDAGSESLAATTAELKNADGAAADMAATMLDNLNGAITIFKSGIEGAAIAIGNVLLPHIRSIVEWLTSLVEKFNGLDEKAQKIIVIIATLSGAFLLLTGPILLIIGFIPSILAGFTALSTVGTTIMSVLAGTATAASGVGAAIASMVLPVTLVVAALAALTVGAIKFTNEMSQRAIPEVERFGEGVSETTQQAVGNFMDMTEKANLAFKELSWGQQAVTAEMANNMSASQQEITNTLLTAINDRHAKEIDFTQSQFLKLESLSDEQKASIIEKTNARYEEEAAIVESGNTRIQEILQLAAEGNRAITEMESAEILSIREEMSIKAVEVLSVNEQEQRMILERMRDNATTLSTEEAAAVVQNSIEKKDKVVNDAEEQFTQTRMWAEQQRDQLGTLSAEEAQQVINEAQAKRDKSILAAEEAHANVVAEAQAQADEHVNLVDWETGEILTKWDLFKQKHEDIWNEIKNKFSGILESIKSVTSTAFNKVKETIETIVDAILQFVKPELDKLKAFWEENGEDILNFVKLYFGQIKGNIEMVMGIIKGIFQVVWPIISNVVTIAWNLIKTVTSNSISLVLGIIQTIMKLLQGDWEGAWNTIKGTAETILNNIVSFFEGINLLQIGKDIIQGLINGIGSMVDAVKKKVEEIAALIPDGIKKFLNIKSPSRVMMELGKFIGQGLGIGIESQKEAVGKIMEDLGYLLIDITDHFASEEVKIRKAANDEIAKIEKRAQEDVSKIQRNAYAKKRKTNQDENLRILRIQQDAAKKVADLEKKATSDSVKLLREADKEKLKEIKLFVDDKKSLEELSLADEAAIWKESMALFSEGTKERVEAQKAYQKTLEAIDKERLDAIKSFVADKKSLDQLSLIDEARIWEEALLLFDEGTKERIEAQKAYKTAVEAVNKEILSINKEFSDKMQKINDDLAKGEQALNDEYNKTFSARVDLIRNSTGLFDEFVAKMDKSGQDLLNNLRSQVVGLEEWRASLDSLWGKIDDEELMKELEAMGPKAAGELKALNSLSEAELAEYVSLYHQKFAEAREQATHELSGMKENTQTGITNMREAANAELEVLEKEWVAKIESVTQATDTELKTLKQVGKDAGQGLLDGLSSMESAIVSKARAIANAVKDAMASALDIHSPSRWMRDFIGKNMMYGWIDGMEAMRSKVIAMAELSTGWMTPDVPVLAGIDLPTYTPSQPQDPTLGAGSSAVNSNGTPGRGDIYQDITLISPKPTSPSDNARLFKQAQRQLGMDL